MLTPQAFKRATTRLYEATLVALKTLPIRSSLFTIKKEGKKSCQELPAHQPNTIKAYFSLSNYPQDSLMIDNIKDLKLYAR
jgi:hypothetical protein